MSLQNKRVPLLCSFKLYASFRDHKCIKLELRKRPIRDKIVRFHGTYYLYIWQMIQKNNRASLLCHFNLCAQFCSLWILWIQTGVMVRKCLNWGHFFSLMILTFDLWSWPSHEHHITPENFMIRQQTALQITSCPWRHHSLDFFFLLLFECHYGGSRFGSNSGSPPHLESWWIRSKNHMF